MENSESVKKINESAESEVTGEVLQGEIALKHGQFDIAKELFLKASSKDPYCWQAYWGLFKASVRAKNDNEIYFPGFIDDLKKSETTGDVPDYVEYYKSAKFNATAQHSKEINFTFIEMEFRKVDQANNELRGLVSKLREDYESADIERIKSTKGKDVCKKLNDKNDELVKWKNLDYKGNKMNIAMLFVGICIANLGLMFTQIDLFASSEIGGILTLISMFGPAAIIIWLFFPSIIGIAFGIAVGVVSYMGITFINRLCSDVFVLRLVFVTAFIAVGSIVMLIYIKKIKDCKISGKKIKTTYQEMQEIMDEVVDAFLEDIGILYRNPITEKYRISFPVDEKLNFDSYITKNEEIYDILQDYI